MARQAFSQQDKDARRSGILVAARRLFLEGGGRLPSASEIASAAGLAKGTVYLYFRSKEEIFLALLAADSMNWLGGVDEACAASGEAARGRVRGFVEAYRDYLVREPDMLRLDALRHGVLEVDVDPETLAASRASFGVRMEETAGRVEAALELAPGSGERMLLRALAISRGLWQAHQPCGTGEAEARIGEFGRELAETLEEYVAGALALAREAGRTPASASQATRTGS